MNNSLRIKLAEALGWKDCKVDEEAVYCDDVTEPGYVTTRTLRGVSKGYRQQLPDFEGSFDSGAALLVEHLRKEGWAFELFDHYDSWECSVSHDSGDKPNHTVRATTLPLAIVAAACAVLSIDTSAKG